MAGVQEERKGGRSTNVEVNIVPFIDLMSVLVIFLLITAVWSQVSMIQIGSSIYGKKSNDDKVEPPPKVEVAFRVDIKETGYIITIGKGNKVNIPKIGEDFDISKLTSELKKVKEIYPDKQDCVLTIQDPIAYMHLIAGMDALLQSGFPQISISTQAATD